MLVSVQILSLQTEIPLKHSVTALTKDVETGERQILDNDLGTEQALWLAKLCVELMDHGNTIRYDIRDM